MTGRRSRPAGGEPAEKSFWQLIPRKTLARVFFYLLVLFAVLGLQRCAAPYFGRMLEWIAPKPSPKPAGRPAAGPAGRSPGGDYAVHMRVPATAAPAAAAPPIATPASTDQP